MGSIKVSWLFLFSIFFLGIIIPLGAQAALLNPEIERLERLSQVPLHRHGALVQLARLHHLSGDREKALESWIGAAYADPGKRDDQALLEAAKLLVSMGEYDQAGAELRTVLLTNNDHRVQQAAWLLYAELEAFRTRDPSALSHLLDFPIYAEIQSRIFYTLWRITEDTSWRTRLLNSHSQSPEAEIVRERNGIIAVSNPHWLLLPPRESSGVRDPPAQILQPQVSSDQSDQSGQSRVVRSQSPDSNPTVLQTGLFSREDNARAMAIQLSNAGFWPEIRRRTVGSIEYWAVNVIPDSDINLSIRELRDAGFEAFPVSN